MLKLIKKDFIKAVIWLAVLFLFMFIRSYIAEKGKQFATFPPNQQELLLKQP